MGEVKEPTNQHCQDGDIYLNPSYGDLWVVNGEQFVLINDGYTIGIDGPVGFVKVGHIDCVRSGLMVATLI